MAKEDIYCV